MNKLPQKKHFYLYALVLITFLFLSPTLLNGFLNWNDVTYITNNDLIKDFSFNGIKNILGTSNLTGTYTPLTMLSWAADYNLGGLDPVVFHFFNLLFHLLVVSMVFYLTKLLSKNQVVSFITALLFGIHPMHVEVVGWVSARKDILYTLFFLASLIAYYFYTEKQTKYPKYYYYIACLLLYVLSLLSSVSAIILPLVLVLLDYLKARKLNIKLFLEKALFLILSIIFLFIDIQAKGGKVFENYQFTTFIESLSLGIYGYFIYLIKAVIPFNLSLYHPYSSHLGISNPWFYYVLAILILGLFVWLFTKIKKNRNIVFGFGFFLITLLPVIKILPLGTTVITADSYLSYFGLFYLIGLGIVRLYNHTNKFKKVIVFTMSIYIALLGVSSFQYSKTFKSGKTLWSNVIDHYPNDFLAYMNRADYWESKKQYSKTIQDLDKAIVMNPNYHLLYYNRSFAYRKIGKKQLAIADLTQVIKTNPDFVSGYLNRGIYYGELEKTNLAISDFTKVIQLTPNNHLGFYNRALCYKKTKQFPKALTDVSELMAIKESFAPAYYLRGELNLFANNINNAFKDFTKALAIDPSIASAHTQRGNLWLDKANFKEALKDFNKAVLLDETQTDAYINLGIIYMNLKKYEKAELNFELAKKLASNNYLIYYNNGLLFQLTKNNSKALQEFDKCLQIQPIFSPALKSKKEVERLL